MKKITWLAASIALGLTVGFGAGLLNGDNLLTTSASSATLVDEYEGSVDATDDVTGRGFSLPGITVVVQIPAKADGTYALAGSASYEYAGLDEAADEGWTMPGITVVAQIPSTGSDAYVLASSTEVTQPHSDEPAVEASVEDEWTMPGITVVANVPAKQDRAFGPGGPGFAANRPAVSRIRSPRMPKPAVFYRDHRRFDDRRIEAMIERIERHS